MGHRVHERIIGLYEKNAASRSLIALCRERFPGMSWQVADMRAPRSASGMTG